MPNPIDLNPPIRRNESFPKTTTIPEGWLPDPVLESYNNTDMNGAALNENHGTRPTTQVDENLFTRGLEPFPKPNTLPIGWDLSGLK